MVLVIGKALKEYEMNNKDILIKNEANDNIEIDSSEEIPVLHSLSEIIALFPSLSKHIITNAINKGKLKVTWIGNRRFFCIDDIKNYLSGSEEKIVVNSNWRDDK